MPVTRGSRTNILRWVESSDFIGQLHQLLEPIAKDKDIDVWMPKGFCDPTEARLNQLEEYLGSRLRRIDWDKVWDWWLVHNNRKRVNTPNWDLAGICWVQEQKGLVLVEAKAHVGELEIKGKKLGMVHFPSELR